MMNYQQTLDWMFAKLPMYQRIGDTAFKKDLTNIRLFCEHLDHPETKFPSIHVGGTNGKGSTSHMLSSILQEAGYKVGLYTSPHLKNFTERIKINGIEIDEQFVVDFIHTNKSFLERNNLSFFEMTVGLAFDYFVEQQVDIAIIEVGLGGRLDSTNIITPLVSVITNIGWDHMQFLGDTLPKIAAEKAGIIKPNVPVVISERQEEVAAVFVEKARQMNAHITFASDADVHYKTDLLGEYQQKNYKAAVVAINRLKAFYVSEQDIVKGLQNVVKNTNLKGRWQLLGEQPKIICDTAHNKNGLELVLQQLQKENFEHLHIVLGFVSDKNYIEILGMFPKNATYYFCQPNIPRGLDAAILHQEATQLGYKGLYYASVSEALRSAKKNALATDLIYIGGSTFVVAEVV